MSLNTILPFISSKILPLIFSIIGFGLLILVHELGHFFFCKAFSIHTPTFSIGFGSKIIERKIGATNFRISAIPLGGYVEIAGLSEIGQGEQESAQITGENSFNEKPFWQKFLVLSGGILFNLIFAYFVFCCVFIVGEPNKKQIITIAHIVKGSPAEKAGLKEKDEVLRIQDVSLIPDSEKTITTSSAQATFLQIIRDNPTKPINLIILRENKEIKISVVPESTQENNLTVGKIGVFPVIPMPRLSIFQAATQSFWTTLDWITKITDGIKHMFQSKSLEGAGGPVRIFEQGFRFAQNGIIAFLLFLAIISVSLAVFNLLPLGITDGGQLLLTTIEAIIRRPIPEYIRLAINVISLILFAFLFIYLTYKDTVQIFGKTFMNIYKKIIHLF
ncbi:MAG: M50 family metallopeptidase [bacterium]